MGLIKKINIYKERIFVAMLLNAFAITAFAGEETDVAEESVNYLLTFLISITIIVLPLQVLFQVFQIKTGRKEPREALTPIMWTVFAVMTPTICAAIATILYKKMGSY